MRYIKTKLKTFNKDFRSLQKRVTDDVTAAIKAAEAITSVQVAEATAALATKIAEESNPIAAVFSGVDTMGLRERAEEVAKAAAGVAKAVALAESLKALATDTIAIGTDLHNNQNQIKSMVNLVNKIKNNQADNIDDDAETFIAEYFRYKPKVDRHRMARNIAMWGAFKESTCKLLDEVEGVGAQVGKAIAGSHLLCERLQGTIAEFSVLRENIFDFQFDLVDRLAAVVRGNVAEKLAASIQAGKTGEIFKADQLLGAFLMAQNSIQSQAWLYCDKLEYKDGGQRVQPCLPETGLFTNDDLDNLVAFTDHQTYIFIERTVYIPSRPQHNGDLGFIDIRTLARKKMASFRLPQNITWLHIFGWSLIGEWHAPYVENFQLFLPKRRNQNNRKTSTRIVVTADRETGSYVSADRRSSALYKLPETQTSYVTVYQEGYRSSTCPKEIPNPYSLCNNLPKICHISTNVAGGSLLPTTLSRWRVTYSVQSGEKEERWLAPIGSATDLNLIAKLTLRLLPSKLSRNRRSEMRRADDQQDVCCPSGTYRSSLVERTACTPCPPGSKQKLKGYYCERCNGQKTEC